MQFRRHGASVLRIAGGASYAVLIFAVCRNGMDADGVRGLALLYLALGLPMVLLALFLARRIAGGRGLVQWSSFAICLLALAVPVWRLAPLLQSHYKGFFLLQDLGLFGALAYCFGSSLGGGREPLCTYFARLVREPLSPALLGYTRAVTAVWTAFFLVVGGISTVLFIAASSTVWAFFTNLLTPVLVVLLFAIEHACRWLFLAPEDRVGFRQTFTAIRKGGYRGQPLIPAVQAGPAS